MKVFIQIVDTTSNIFQYGCIDEPVMSGHEVTNALAHFGINYGNCEWDFKSDYCLIGKVKGTTKVVSVIHEQQNYVQILI